MNVKFYMDVHVPRAVTIALRLRGIEVLTAQEDDSAMLDDDLLLLRATLLRRVLVSHDDDLLREGCRMQREGLEFAGVIYTHQLFVPVGQVIEDLALIGLAMSAEEWMSRVEHLPLR